MKMKSIALLLAVAATSASAQSVEESVIQQLQAQGFSQITVERTFLGRLRIEAYSATLERELATTKITTTKTKRTTTKTTTMMMMTTRTTARTMMKSDPAAQIWFAL